MKNQEYQSYFNLLKSSGNKSHTYLNKEILIYMNFCYHIGLKLLHLTSLQKYFVFDTIFGERLLVRVLAKIYRDFFAFV